MLDLSETPRLGVRRSLEKEKFCHISGVNGAACIASGRGSEVWGGDACATLAGEALSLPIRFLVEPKGKRTMTQGIHLVVPVSERDHRQGGRSSELPSVPG
jgi:hypothetical protein